MPKIKKNKIGHLSFPNHFLHVKFCLPFMGFVTHWLGYVCNGAWDGGISAY